MDEPILYIGHDDANAQRLQSALKAQGYDLLCTSDADEAAELLRTRLLHAVCIEGRVVDDHGSAAIGESLTVARSQAPVLFVQTSERSASHPFEADVDLVMDERAFLHWGHYMIEELRAAKFPVFTQWLDEWKQRCTA